MHQFAGAHALIVVNSLMVVALILDKLKTTPVPIRIVIVNLLAASLTVILGLYLEHLTALVLISGEQPLPPVGFCSFIIWLFAGGGASRLVFTATFSAVMFATWSEKGQEGSQQKLSCHSSWFSLDCNLAAKSPHPPSILSCG